MGNRNGKVYGLTFLSPILDDERATPSHDLQIRYALAQWKVDETSPFAMAPGTHLCRLVVMDDVIYVGMPACEEHLKSKYLVFETNCDGDAGEYLAGLAGAIPEALDAVWGHCVGYPGAAGFVEYMKRCQVETSFFFAAVNDRSVTEALRGLMVQRAAADFACAHQGKPAAELQAEFLKFYGDVTSRPGPKPGLQRGRLREIKTGGHNE
jgi:hypothetical protein